METRYFITLVHSDQRNDKTLNFGTDVGKATASLEKMIQEGAPDGCRLGIFFNSKKLIKTRRLYSADELKASIDQLNSRDEGRQSEIADQTRDIMERFRAVKTEADNLGIPLPNTQLVVLSSEQDQSKSSLDPVDPESILGEFLALQQRAAAAGVELPIAPAAPAPENLDAPLADGQGQPAASAPEASNQLPRVVNPIPSLVPPKAKDGAGKAKSEGFKAKDGAEGGNLLESA